MADLIDRQKVIRILQEHMYKYHALGNEAWILALDQIRALPSDSRPNGNRNTFETTEEHIDDIVVTRYTTDAQYEPTYRRTYTLNVYAKDYDSDGNEQAVCVYKVTASNTRKELEQLAEKITFKHMNKHDCVCAIADPHAFVILTTYKDEEKGTELTQNNQIRFKM